MRKEPTGRADPHAGPGPADRCPPPAATASGWPMNRLRQPVSSSSNFWRSPASSPLHRDARPSGPPHRRWSPSSPCFTQQGHFAGLLGGLNFVFDGRGRRLLQRHAAGPYCSGGLPPESHRARFADRVAQVLRLAGSRSPPASPGAPARLPSAVAAPAAGSGQGGTCSCAAQPARSSVRPPPQQASSTRRQPLRPPPPPGVWK